MASCDGVERMTETSGMPAEVGKTSEGHLRMNEDGFVDGWNATQETVGGMSKTVLRFGGELLNQFNEMADIGFSYRDYKELFETETGMTVSCGVLVFPRKDFKLCDSLSFSENEGLIVRSSGIDELFGAGLQNPFKNRKSMRQCVRSLRAVTPFDEATFPDALFGYVLHLEGVGLSNVWKRLSIVIVANDDNPTYDGICQVVVCEDGVANFMDDWDAFQAVMTAVPMIKSQKGVDVSVLSCDLWDSPDAWEVPHDAIADVA